MASSQIQWPAGDTAARILGASGREYGAFAALGLAALSLPYRGAVWLNNQAFDLGIRRAHRAAVPVLSIGNIVAGGAGKTPFTRWLAHLLVERGRRVAILHGGYGSDEPGLHRKWQPTAIIIEQKDRVAAAATAVAQGADVLVLDDAFQHRRLARDLDIVLLPAESTSRQLLPRGPLREPQSALGRADLIVVTRKTAPAAAAIGLAARFRQEHHKPVAVAAMLPAGFRHDSEPASLPAGAAIAVASVARPDLLLQQLQGAGVQVDRLLAYPDHFEYRASDHEYIRRTAHGRPIVTTEKDAIKLLSFFEPGELWVLEQQVVIDDGYEEITALIERVL